MLLALKEELKQVESSLIITLLNTWLYLSFYLCEDSAKHLVSYLADNSNPNRSRKEKRCIRAEDWRNHS